MNSRNVMTFIFLCFCLSACQSYMKSENKRSMSLVPQPIVIAHRGASGHTPEHTLHAYELAVQMGADMIEPDLVSTKDGVLIARHENEISGTTDVAEKFAKLKKTKTIDGEKITGWFTEDLTLKQIKTLRAKERLPFRDQKQNGMYEVPTFEEVLALRLKLSGSKVIGVVPELKHSTYFRSIGLPLEEKLIAILKKHKLDSAEAPVLVQSFEIDNLKMLRQKINVQLVQLLDDPEKSPADQLKNSKPITYKEMATLEGLKNISKYAQWVSPHKYYVIPPQANGRAGAPTAFVTAAHGLGLKVAIYTFRNEDQYLVTEEKGQPVKEYLRFYAAGVDALFSDFADTAVAARAQFKR